MVFYKISLWIMAALILFPPAYSMGQDGQKENAGIGDDELRITADRLVSDGNAEYILFSGNVTTTYKDTTILSDQMKVFYENTEKDSSRMDEENIKKIVATGNVSIQFGDRTARCQQAVYLAATRTIILTGEDTRIQSGSDYISGKKITIDQNSDRITVDGSPEKRVKAVFTPQNTKTIDTGGIKNHDDSYTE